MELDPPAPLPRLSRALIFHPRNARKPRSSNRWTKRPGRIVIALAGAPGSGKSTLAERLESRLDKNGSSVAAVLPMDGYHYDDRILIERGLRARKGSPENLDVGGLLHMLGRLRRNEEDEIAVPVFDRDLELSRAGAG